jgi:hypothetical protein
MKRVNEKIAGKETKRIYITPQLSVLVNISEITKKDPLPKSDAPTFEGCDASAI